MFPNKKYSKQKKKFLICSDHFNNEITNVYKDNINYVSTMFIYAKVCSYNESIL